MLVWLRLVVQASRGCAWLLSFPLLHIFPCLLSFPLLHVFPWLQRLALSFNSCEAVRSLVVYSTRGRPFFTLLRVAFCVSPFLHTNCLVLVSLMTRLSDIHNASAPSPTKTEGPSKTRPLDHARDKLTLGVYHRFSVIQCFIFNYSSDPG